jgi:Holliday junction resolvasome RuvABC endonuclease subunit
MPKVLGFDLGLNHGAVIELTDGKLTWLGYYTDSASAAERCSDAHRMKLEKTNDRQINSMMRLAWLENWLDKHVLIPRRPDYVGIEDYAIRAEQGAHYLGELGGIARILVWFRGIPLRLHDPISTKMFATTDGTAKKDLVEECVRTYWGHDFSQYNPPINPKTGKVNRQTSEDLADAFAIAQLVWTEVRLRAGEITTADLDHPKRIQVFNRTTKTYPTNILGREWIHNPKGAPAPHAGLRARMESKIAELEATAPKAARMLKDLLADGV